MKALGRMATLWKSSGRRMSLQGVLAYNKTYSSHDGKCEALADFWAPTFEAKPKNFSGAQKFLENLFNLGASTLLLPTSRCFGDMSKLWLTLLVALIACLILLGTVALALRHFKTRVGTWRSDADLQFG